MNEVKVVVMASMLLLAEAQALSTKSSWNEQNS